MAAAWGRAWRSRISSTAHGGNAGDDVRSLQPAAGGSIASGTTTSSTATAGSRSTTCTATSGSFIVLQPPAPENADHELGEEERVKKLKNIKALVVRFPSDKSAPERWLSELEVAWLFHLQISESGHSSFISGQLLYLARSWIQALFEITQSISIYFGGQCVSNEDGPSASEFIRFFEATLSKMLPFLDAIVAVRTSAGTNDRWASADEPADEKLQSLIFLRDALSTASVQILSSCVDFSEETRDLLPAGLVMAKLDEAIWDTIEETNAGFMSSSSWGIPRSSDIHMITRSLISYIKVLWFNYGSVNRVLHDAFPRGESVPDNENANHLSNLTKEMVHSLEQNLTRNTESCPWNKSLKLLFLINNFHFIHQQMQLLPLAFPMPEFAGKIDWYITRYIQVSWAPLLECLHNPTPRCFFGRNSPLPKFESNFQITYTAQKLWKVPDPGMRRRMREAIVEEVIPDFTEFLKDNTLSGTPRISPQEMKRMLQESFEG